MLKKLFAISILTTFGLCTFGGDAAQAAIVVKGLSGISYEIDTFTGTYREFTAYNELVGNSGALISPDIPHIATAVNTQLGLPNVFNSVCLGASICTGVTTGPHFVYRAPIHEGVSSYAWTESIGDRPWEPRTDLWRYGFDQVRVFGTINHITDEGPEPPPIPTPALLPGLLGIGFSALRKRNRDLEIGT